ncbi:hypothetical protein ACNKHO_00090 [Shigella flexneri]
MQALAQVSQKLMEIAQQQHAQQQAGAEGADASANNAKMTMLLTLSSKK